jgi:hypothetical protein
VLNSLLCTSIVHPNRRLEKEKEIKYKQMYVNLSHLMIKGTAWFTLRSTPARLSYESLDLSQSHVSDVCISYVIVRNRIFIFIFFKSRICNEDSSGPS